jgi:hypothetical protein
MPALPLYDYNKIAKAYAVFNSTWRVARILGCSQFTVRFALKRLGIPHSAPGFTTERRNRKGRGPGAVARWHRDHENVVMPLRPRAIAKLTGHSIQDAYHYLEWRRGAFRKKVARLPALDRFLGEPVELRPNAKNFLLMVYLPASKRFISLHEDEIDEILARLTAPSVSNPNR